MQVLSVFNLKGGVGKTAAAVNLAYAAAVAGRRVLVWDLDPQGAASFYFRVKPRVKGGGKKIVKGKNDLDDLIKGTDFERLDLIPADFSYREFDLRFSEQKASRLKKLIQPLAKEYDLVVFDCPPSMSGLSEQIFRASDLILVPIVPTTLSVRTLGQIREFLAAEKSGKAALRAFFSMVDRRKKLHREIVEARADAPEAMLEAAIPNASAVERMGQERQPVAAFAPQSVPARAFRALWDEVARVLG